MATLNQLRRTGKRPYRRVGRGNGSTRGKQSGRGGKGQTARAGHKIRPEYRDIIKKLPKRRGYGKNRGRTVVPKNVCTLTLGSLDKRFQGNEITRKALIAQGLMGLHQTVKIVGGETSKKFSIKGISISA